MGTKFLALFALNTVLVLPLVTAPPAMAADTDSFWWAKFRQQESAFGGKSSMNARIGAGTAGATSQGSDAGGSTQSGYFTVPAWFASQPQPYERPQEFFRPSLPSDVGSSAGMNAFQASLPWISGGAVAPFGWGWGYRPWLGGWGAPAWSGAFLGTSPLGMGMSSNLWSPLWSGPAFGSLYWGGWGAPAWGGYGWGGWGGYGWGSPASAALWAGAFGNSSARTPGWGEVTPTRVFQSAPSKPSGNYYAPSTVDTTAAGSYYATTAPSQIPIITPKKPITNFWGPGGNPFGKEVTPPSELPWNK